MFASLKNKIREETGSDISKLTAKITTSTVQRIDSLRGRRSGQGSASSINSIISSDGVKDDSIDNEEIRKRISKIESDFARRLENKDREWSIIVNEKDKQLYSLEKEKTEAIKDASNLRIKLETAEELKKKLVERQEDKEQIENLQTQELSKIKHLILLREQELADKTASLKDATSQLDKIRSEVARLRRQEEHASDLQDDLESLRHSSARDLAALATKLAESQEEQRHLSDLIVVLRQRVENETSGDEHVNTERRLLEQRLEEAHLHLADIKTSWSDKITFLETQVGRLSRQAAEEGAERRRAIQDKEVIFEKLQQSEAEIEFNKLELINKETKIQRLTTDVEEMSLALKNIRLENEEAVTFLRTQVENANTEVKVIRKNLETSENDLEKWEDECSKLKISVDSEHQTNGSLRTIVVKLEKELAEEKSNSLNVQKTLSRVTSEKNAALMRNAEISQQMEIVKQEKKRQESEMNDLLNKIDKLEEEHTKHKQTKVVEQQLRSSIVELEDQMSEKNKNIKTLQLRLADMKKTLQHELRTPGNPNYHTDLIDNNSPAILTPSQISVRQFPRNVRRDEDDVNFKYLKHVVLKFLTSRDYEAQHLTKAISTVLKFTPDEERLVAETVEWKKSWFGSKPKLSHNTRHMSSS